MVLITLLLAGCQGGDDSGTGPGVSDTSDTGATASSTCTAYSVEFESNPEQLPKCLGDISNTMSSLPLGTNLDDDGTAPKGVENAIAVAVTSAMNGQIARHLANTYALKNTTEVVEQTCAFLEPNLIPLSRVGKKPEEICGKADKWAANAGLTAQFACTDVTLAHSMTAVLEELFGTDVEGFWMHMEPLSSTDVELLWLPMFLAMQHGASPAVLFYESSSASGYAAILELGMAVKGPEASVKAFWDFVEGSFTPSTYSSGVLASHIASLEITLPSRIIWRDSSGEAQSWKAGDASTPPFFGMTTSSGLIDPCAPLYDKTSETISAGGVAGECENSLERMIAVGNELKTHIDYFGAVPDDCTEYHLDLSLGL